MKLDVHVRGCLVAALYRERDDACAGGALALAAC